MPTPGPAKQCSLPQGATVGPLHMPELYGGRKERKEYLPWSHAEDRLVRSRSYWICTARPDGRPHSIPVWGMWIEGALYFGTARSTRKARNLLHNPAVSVHLESGDDVIILEGKAAEVSDPATFKKLDAASKDKYKMPLLLMPESVVYAVRPRVVLAWLEKNMPGTGTRWEFAED
jgi:pyridoxamine 5'-phosphate oxidase-like protein